MSNVDTYIKNAKRGEFQWECAETTDGYGYGTGVQLEEVSLKGRSATITKESDNEFEVDVIIKHSINYYNDKEKESEIIDYRSSRKLARILVERLINKDIEKDEKQ